MKKTYIIKRLFHTYAKKHIKFIILAGFLSILVAASTATIAWLLDPAIKKIFIDKDKTFLFLIPIAIIIAFASKGISLYLARRTMIKVSAEVTKDIQVDVFKSIINLDTQSLDNKNSGKFISHLNFDVTLLTNLVSVGLFNLMKDTLTLAGLLFIMFYQNWKLALLAIIMIPIASIAASSLGKRMGKVVTQSQEKSGILISYLSEMLKNYKIIKIYQKEKFEINRATKFINDLKDKMAKSAIVLIRATPIMEALTGIMIAALIFYSATLVGSGELDVNNFFSFLAAMMLAYQPVRSLATLNITFSQGFSGAYRILPLIDQEKKIYENDSLKNIIIDKANIEFKNINFSYFEENKDQVLHKINFKINGGETVALVGHSGAGKSTIMNLIPRFYDPASGDILIDDQSIYNSKLSSLRKNISLVSQEITLFDDTVRSNIAYAATDSSDEQIIEASEFSKANEFIQKLPEKYDTIIGENGVRLSGGEKQRISIARAILKNAPIILLDEATSSLDADTEHKIQQAISYLTKNKTTIIIAHRLSTIFRADKIFVIDRGKIVDQGTHLELLKNSLIYQNFYNKQLKK
jgi:subfamily B ATP-binding cassette protein MsbA